MSSANQMAELIARKDWKTTPLGRRDSWPSYLTTSVQIILDSKYPMFVWWGEQLINIYNDGYIPMLGNRHPKALGESAPKVWADVWDVVGPQTEIVFREGRATWNEELSLFMSRHGFLEETYFTFSYSPIRNDRGTVLGLFCAVTEETPQVLKGRRLNTLRQISTVTERSDSVNEVCRLTSEVLCDHVFDIPFSLVYLWDAEERALCLEAQSGVQAGSNHAPVRFVTEGDVLSPHPWWPASLAPGWQETVFPIPRELVFPGGAWPEACLHGVVLPLQRWEREKKAGYLIVGISPRLALDDSYREFLNLLARSIAGSINRAHSLTEERRRREILAELNRAKTEFFSNVSHEFRTPLTLILGSLNEAMNPNGASAGAALAVAHRNTLRMLKLVNTLLDFSSLEAGRMKAIFEPVDLDSLTVDLASSFESAMKKAGLEFQVTCAPLSRPVYVDRNAWEKIMLNLLSNALKFTLDGQVSLDISQGTECVDVRIRDSGVGISREAIAHVFDRFFRAKEARGRTFEGTGIGLALVKELVLMHGGKIHVDSEPGKGSVFTVTLPFGFQHLPADQVRHTSTGQSDETLVQSFILESEQWVREGDRSHQMASQTVSDASHPTDQSRPVIVLVDDNRDMREYVSRLLRPEYEVVTASDGQEALELIHKVHPDLVLSDIMMPRIDGLDLLRHVRAARDRQSTPFILISARAGQDAEKDGLLTGADDYIAKPFTAGELLTRIKKTLGLSTMRRASIEHEARFQHLAHHPEIMTWITDASGNCIFLSQTWYDFTGQTDETGFESGWLDAIHPDDRASAKQEFQNSNKQRSPFRREYRLRRTGGEYHWVLDSASPRFATDGHYLGYVGLVLDLTYQKETEEKIRESEERFRTLANNISQFAWMADGSGWVFWYNERWFEYTGTTLEEMQGWGWKSVHHPDHVDRVVRKVSECFQTGRIWEDTFPLRSKDGEYRWFLSRAIPIRDQNGHVIRWMGTNTDITELQTTQQQLQQLTGRLEQRIAERTVELKHNQTRLQGLIGELILTEQRERRRIAEELHDFLAQLLVACRLRVHRLEQMMDGEGDTPAVLRDIDRILDQSLSYTRSLVVQLVPSVLYQFGLLAALRWLADDMKQYDLSVDVTMERDHLTLTENEAVLVFQSVRELMMNVLKHAGVYRLGLAVRTTPSNEICVEVSDEGAGFDPHRMEEKSQTPSQFGLFSIRERMGLLGGRMSVDSCPGSGTRIRLYLPIPDQDREKSALASSTQETPASKQDQPRASRREGERTRVILVDDHGLVREGLRSLMDNFSDVEVIGEAANGLEAIGLAESLHPDVMVMDVNMPGMDGIEATRHIRQNYKGVQVIGLSVRLDKETERAMREAGAVAYLSKESAGQELHHIIGQVVRLRDKYA